MTERVVEAHGVRMETWENEALTPFLYKCAEIIWDPCESTGESLVAHVESVLDEKEAVAVIKKTARGRLNVIDADLSRNYEKFEWRNVWKQVLRNSKRYGGKNLIILHGAPNLMGLMHYGWGTPIGTPESIIMHELTEEDMQIMVLTIQSYVRSMGVEVQVIRIERGIPDGFMLNPGDVVGQKGCRVYFQGQKKYLNSMSEEL